MKKGHGKIALSEGKKKFFSASILLAFQRSMTTAESPLSTFCELAWGLKVWSPVDAERMACKSSTSSTGGKAPALPSLEGLSGRSSPVRFQTELCSL